MLVADDFGILDIAHAVEELEKIALGCVERKVADVKPRRRNFDRLRFTFDTRRLRAIARLRLLFPNSSVAVREKTRD